MPALPPATETDTAVGFAPATITRELPVAVDTALPMAIDSQLALQIEPGTAQADLPRAIEATLALTATPLAVGELATGAERDMALPLTVLVDDGEYGEAIDAIDRIPVYTLKADWNRNGLYDHVLSDLTDLVEDVTVDRALSGTLPVEVGLVEGYSSAELAVTLSGRWRKPPESFTDRVNLAINPSAQTNTEGYSVVPTGGLAVSTVSRTTTNGSLFGTAYFYSRPADTGTSGYAYIRCPLVRVVPGITYTFSAYRTVVGFLSTTYVGVDWLDSSGNQIAGGTVNGPAIAGSGWARGSVTAPAPGGAVYARQFLVEGTVSYANYARWDGVLAESGTQLGEYFDGDTPGASWNGVPHASTSTILAENDDDYEDSAEDLVDVFGPYRSDSPLFGKPILKTPIYLETGFIAEDGPRLTRRFTGVVSQIHPQSAARSVELRAVDSVALLRESVTLPGAGMFESIMTQRGPEAYRQRINSQWLIDYALRRNGIFTSPPPREDAILSVTGHGSMIPETGWGGAPEEYFATYRGEMWQPGAFGGALSHIANPIGRWWLTEQVTAAAGTGFGISMWMVMGGRTVDSRMFTMDLTTDGSYFIRFGLDATGRPWVAAFNPNQTNEIRCTYATFVQPTGTWWKFVGVHVAFAATTMTATFRVDEQTYTSTAVIGARANNWKPGIHMNYNWSARFTNFQMWKSPTPPSGGWTGEDPNWIPQAFLDPGVNELTAVPELIGQDTWELIKAVTDAEGSTFQFDEYGKPWFRTSKGDQYYGRQPDVPEIVSADRNLSDLVSVTDETTVRNIINIKTKSQLVGDWEDYYTSPSLDAFDCAPASTTYFDLELPVAAYEIPPPLSTFGSINNPGAWRYLGGDGFIYYGSNENWQSSSKQGNVKNYIRCMVIQRDQPQFWVGSGIQIRVVRLTPWKMQVIINNQQNFWIRFATMTKYDATTGQPTDDGEPALIIPARLIKESPEQIETYTDNGSVATYGPSVYDIGGSDERWRQRPEGLRGLASEVLATTANPVPVLDAVDVPHDPRRKLGDRVLLRDPQGMGEVMGSIAGLSQTYSSSGTTDKITVRPLAPPGLGLLDDPTHGLLDASLVVGP